MKHEPKSQRESKAAIAARRSFLKAVGASAAALPFYKMLEDSHAQAVAGSLPPKFVGVGAFHGTTQKFFARLPGEPLGPDTPIGDISYTDSCLRPFNAFKSKINVFEGFDYGVANLPDGRDLSSHGSMGFFLTGCEPSEANPQPASLDHKLLNPSLDQYLAARYGNGQRFRSVELKTEQRPPSTYSNLAFGEGGTALSSLTSPQQIWDKYFAGVNQSTDPFAQAEAAHKRAVDKSILGYAIGDLQRLQARLAPPEWQKLDQHVTVMNDLSKRLDTAVAAGCKPPPRHPQSGNANPADNYLVGNADGTGVADLDRVANFQIELLAQILICDLSRFATIVLPGQPGDPSVGPLLPSLGPKIALGGTDVYPVHYTQPGQYTDIQVPANFHLEIAHKSQQGLPPFPQDDKALAINQAVSALHRYYHTKVANLMQRLADAGVLDNTVILIGQDGGAGFHTIRNVPIVMVAGANTGLRAGRRITHPDRVAGLRAGAEPVVDGKSSYKSQVKPSSQNSILVAVANAFHAAAGAPPIEKYGTSTYRPELTNGITGLV